MSIKLHCTINFLKMFFTVALRLRVVPFDMLLQAVLPPELLVTNITCETLHASMHLLMSTHAGHIMKLLVANVTFTSPLFGMHVDVGCKAAFPQEDSTAEVAVKRVITMLRTNMTFQHALQHKSITANTANVLSTVFIVHFSHFEIKRTFASRLRNYFLTHSLL